ncbi:hypothetical protein UlMin_026496 [Ulmus minor]
MPSMEILKSISGIKVYVESLLLITLLGWLLCTKNYCIQFYSLFDDCIISEVGMPFQVCERNHQPSDEVAVTSVALSQDGSTMCTTEVKLAEEGIGALVCLKFWASDSLNKQFSLSTIIYEPHRDAEISIVVFHPSRQMAVTASYGGDFKIWVSNDEIQQKHKMLQNAAATFSVDGSVLVVVGESLTIVISWNHSIRLNTFNNVFEDLSKPKIVVVSKCSHVSLPTCSANYTFDWLDLVSASPSSQPVHQGSLHGLCKLENIVKKKTLISVFDLFGIVKKCF